MSASLSIARVMFPNPDTAPTEVLALIKQRIAPFQVRAAPGGCSRSAVIPFGNDNRCRCNQFTPNGPILSWFCRSGQIKGRAFNRVRQILDVIRTACS
jgi:hypothetical protein